jgi:hypothetical protein
MDQKLDDKLCADFPEIFADRRGKHSKTAMCWGFECADGWEPLIRMICARIMSPIRRLEYDLTQCGAEDTDMANTIQNKLSELRKNIPVAVQVKEKFGGLRFYVRGGDQRVHDIIAHGEAMSYYVCQDCGTMTTAQLYPFSWYSTLCDRHADERHGEEAAHYRNKTGAWAPDND